MTKNTTRTGRPALRQGIDYSSLPDDALVSAREGAALRGVGLSTWWEQVKRGEIAAPRRFGKRCVRWTKKQALGI